LVEKNGANTSPSGRPGPRSATDTRAMPKPQRTVTSMGPAPWLTSTALLTRLPTTDAKTSLVERYPCVARHFEVQLGVRARRRCSSTMASIGPAKEDSRSLMRLAATPVMECRMVESRDWQSASSAR